MLPEQLKALEIYGKAPIPGPTPAPAPSESGVVQIVSDNGDTVTVPYFAGKPPEADTAAPNAAPSTALVPITMFGTVQQYNRRDLWRPGQLDYNPYAPRNFEDPSARSLRLAGRRLEHRPIIHQEDPEIAELEAQTDATLAAAKLAVAEVLNADSGELPALRKAQLAALGRAPLALTAAPSEAPVIPSESDVAEPGGAFFTDANTTPTTLLPIVPQVSAALTEKTAEVAFVAVPTSPEAPNFRLVEVEPPGAPAADRQDGITYTAWPLEKGKHHNGPDGYVVTGLDGRAPGVMWVPDGNGGGYWFVAGQKAAPEAAPAALAAPPHNAPHLGRAPHDKNAAPVIQWVNAGNGGAPANSLIMPKRQPDAALSAAKDEYVSVMADVEIPASIKEAFTEQELSEAEFNERMRAINTERASLEKAIDEGEIPDHELGDARSRATLLAHQESELVAKGWGGKTKFEDADPEAQTAFMQRLVKGLKNY